MQSVGQLVCCATSRDYCYALHRQLKAENRNLQAHGQLMRATAPPLNTGRRTATVAKAFAPDGSGEREDMCKALFMYVCMYIYMYMTVGGSSMYLQV